MICIACKEEIKKDEKYIILYLNACSIEECGEDNDTTCEVTYCHDECYDRNSKKRN